MGSALVLRKDLESNIITMKEVALFADLASVTSPTSGQKVVVISDTNNSNKKAIYQYSGTAWVFSSLIENIDHNMVFTKDRNIYITNANRQLIKLGDVLPYEDITALQTANPAILNKLYITKKGKLYYYSSDTSTYKLVSGGGGSGGGTNRLADVATYALIATTYPKPDDFDSVVVTADEGHDGQTTWYYFDGVTWAYQGIYFNEIFEINVSDRGVRTSDITAATNYTIPFKYLVGKKHLEIFLEDELLINGVDYTEVGTVGYAVNVIKFTNTIPKEARVIFRRLVSSADGDSRISRITKDVWLNYLALGYSEFDAKVLTSGLSLVSNRTPNVTNITDNAVTTFVIPKDKQIGYRIKVRKAHAGTAVITISCETATEKFTPSLFSSLTLTSDGDYWELEKVTATRWDLVEGYEKGSNTNGKYTKYHHGLIVSKRNLPKVTTSADGSFNLTMPIQPLSGANVHMRTIVKSHTDNGVPGNNIIIGPWNNTSWGIFIAYKISDGTRIANTTIPFGSGHDEEIICESRWY